MNKQIWEDLLWKFQVHERDISEWKYVRSALPVISVDDLKVFWNKLPRMTINGDLTTLWTPYPRKPGIKSTSRLPDHPSVDDFVVWGESNLTALVSALESEAYRISDNIEYLLESWIPAGGETHDNPYASRRPMDNDRFTYYANRLQAQIADEQLCLLVTWELIRLFTKLADETEDRLMSIDLTEYEEEEFVPKSDSLLDMRDGFKTYDSVYVLSDIGTIGAHPVFLPGTIVNWGGEDMPSVVQIDKSYSNSKDVDEKTYTDDDGCYVHRLWYHMLSKEMYEYMRNHPDYARVWLRELGEDLIDPYNCYHDAASRIGEALGIAD